ncbi:MAG: MFS transporter [Sphingobium sp.]
MIRSRFPLIAFCMAHCGKSLMWTATDALSLYIVIKIVEIPPVMAGVLFIRSSLWNAVMDGAWGYCLGRRPGLQRSLPHVSAGAIVVAGMAFAILPVLPPGSTAMAAVALLVFRTSFSLLDVPHNAVAAALVPAYGHLGIARWRSLLGAAMTIAIGLAALPLIAAEGGATTTARLIFCALAILAMALLAPLPWLVRIAAPGMGATPPGSDGPVQAGAPSGSLILFCLVQMIGFAALAAMGKTMLHAATLPPIIAQYSLLLLSVVRLGAISFWMPVAARLGSPTALACAYMLSAAAILALPVTIPLGMASTILILCLLGTATGGMALLVWASVSELVAGEGGNGGAKAARGYGLFTATSKIGLGISGLMTGAWIGWVGTGVSGGSLWSLAAFAASICCLCAVLGLVRLGNRGTLLLRKRPDSECGVASH